MIVVDLIANLIPARNTIVLTVLPVLNSIGTTRNGIFDTSPIRNARPFAHAGPFTNARPRAGNGIFDARPIGDATCAGARRGQCARAISAIL